MKELEAVDIHVRAFSETVQRHLRNVSSDGVIKSTHLTAILDDAIQITIGGRVEDGFQAIAFTANRDCDSDEEGFPVTLENNPSPVCHTVYEDKTSGTS